MQAFTAAEVGTLEREAAAETGAEASHDGPVGAAAMEAVAEQPCFGAGVSDRPRKAPETPTRGTSALVRLSALLSLHRDPGTVTV